MATSGADTSFLEEEGPVIKSAARDLQSRPGFKEKFADPIKEELEAVMDGTGLVMDGTPGAALGAERAAVKMVARVGDVTRPYQGNELYKLLNLNTPFLYATDLDLPLDGETDCTSILNDAMSAGPVTILVDVPLGVRINGPVELQTGCSLAFSAATRVKMGKDGRFVAFGDIRSDEDGDVELAFTGNVAAGVSVIPLSSADLSRVAQYDYVMVIDDRTAGGSPIRVEMAQVIGIETDGDDTVTLDRPLAREFATASNARLAVLDPVVGARLTGAVVRYAEAPDADRVDTFEIAYAVDTIFEGLRVLNDDEFGSRGQMFRTHRAYRSGFRDCFGLRPRYTSVAGEGYGWSCSQSVECFFERGVLEGCRQSISYDSSTDCWADRVISKRPRQYHMRTMGRHEINCWSRWLVATGGINTLKISGAASAGSFNCYVDTVESHGVSGAHLDLVGKSQRCGIRRFRFTGGASAMKAREDPSDITLLCEDAFLTDGVQDTACSSFPIDINGGESDTTGRAVVRAKISEVELVGQTRHFSIYRAPDTIIDECEIRDPGTLAEAHAVLAVNSTGIVVRQCTFHEVEKGFNLTGCTDGRVYGNWYVNWTGTAEYTNGGSNTGLKGVGNTAVGFSATSALPT